MTRIILATVLFMICASRVVAQNNTVPAVDKSPMDMCYFPHQYPVLRIQDKVAGPPVARVIYSRPQRSGRVIFGGLVKSGEVWRLGANEATEIELFRTVRIGGKKVRSGRYTLYAIVNETSWTLILNKDTDTWGAFKYDPKKDVLRTEVPPQKLDPPWEFFSVFFEKTGSGCQLVIGWDTVKITVPIVLES